MFTPKNANKLADPIQRGRNGVQGKAYEPVFSLKVSSELSEMTAVVEDG